jgi:hypothetical protein
MCFDTQHTSINLSINENKYFHSCHASRHNTRAGFDSAPLVSVEKVALPFLGVLRLLALSVTAIQTKQEFF